MKKSTLHINGSYEHLSAEGCLEMCGAHIRLCVKDLVRGKKNIDRYTHLADIHRGKERSSQTVATMTQARAKVYDYNTAKLYLFGGILENSINSMGLPIDEEYIKRVAKNAEETGVLPWNEDWDNSLEKNIEEISDETRDEAPSGFSEMDTI